MSNNDPLAQLRDIHLPTEISWWPLALGWYVLIALVFFSCLGIIMVSYRWYKNNQPKRQALKLLEDYKKSYDVSKNSVAASTEIGDLLKRVALVYFPRWDVASLHGDAWIAFLNQHSKGVDFNPVASMLLELPFKPNAVVDINPLFKRAEAWIKQRRKLCLN